MNSHTVDTKLHGHILYALYFLKDKRYEINVPIKEVTSEEVSVSNSVKFLFHFSDFCCSGHEVA
jgi:hypothetical protein